MSEKNTKQDVDNSVGAEDVLSETHCEKCDEYIAGWKRALADYDNLKKSLLDEKIRIDKSVRLRLFLGIGTISEHFDQALEHSPNNIDEKTKKWSEGVLHIRKELDDFIEKDLEIIPFGTVDEAFDPNKHEAVGMLNDETKPDQIILQVIKRGWMLKDGFISVPAKVIINNKS